jgi:hypothetical protein
MLFLEKAQSSMHQEDKLKCTRCVTNIPRGDMDLLNIHISKTACMSILLSFILVGRSQK